MTSMTDMEKYMSDAKSMFKVYNSLGGRSNFDATYKQHLKLFFFHTLNSHEPRVWHGA